MCSVIHVKHCAVGSLGGLHGSMFANFSLWTLVGKYLRKQIQLQYNKLSIIQSSETHVLMYQKNYNIMEKLIASVNYFKN